MNDYKFHMTTKEFSDMIIDILHNQHYVKDKKYHPQDIAIAFSVAAETVGTAMEWAITRDYRVNQHKNAMLNATNLVKDNNAQGNS